MQASVSISPGLVRARDSCTPALGVKGYHSVQQAISAEVGWIRKSGHPACCPWATMADGLAVQSQRDLVRQMFPFSHFIDGKAETSDTLIVSKVIARIFWEDSVLCGHLLSLSVSCKLMVHFTDHPTLCLSLGSAVFTYFIALCFICCH